MSVLLVFLVFALAFARRRRARPPRLFTSAQRASLVYRAGSRDRFLDRDADRDLGGGS
jgi:hypothetical protein